MSVYIGPAQYPYGGMIMCHMVADDLDELHAMAKQIGVRKWFQDKGKYPHYDVSKGRRSMALHFGAIEADERRIVKIAKACVGKNQEEQDDGQ